LMVLNAPVARATADIGSTMFCTSHSLMSIYTKQKRESISTPPLSLPNRGYGRTY